MPSVTDERARLIMERIGARLATVFGLEQWRIKWTTDRPDNPNHVADVWVNHEYERATARIDVPRHDDERDLADSVRHEMIHVLLSEHKLAATVAASLLGGEGTRDYAIWYSARNIGEERTVARIERLLDRLGLTVDKLMAEVVEADAGTTRVRSLSTDSAAAQGMDGSSCPPGLAPGQPTGGGPVP